jgi:hypothetical protein
MGSVNFDRSQSSGDAYRKIGKMIYDELEYEKKKREDKKYAREIKDKAAMKLFDRYWKGGAEPIGAGENPEVTFEGINSGEMKFKPKPTPKEEAATEALRVQVLNAIVNMDKSKGKVQGEKKKQEFEERKQKEVWLIQELKGIQKLRELLSSGKLRGEKLEDAKKYLNMREKAFNEKYREHKGKDYLPTEETGFEPVKPAEPVKKPEEKNGFFEKIFKKDKDGENAAKEGNNEFEFEEDEEGNIWKVYGNGRQIKLTKEEALAIRRQYGI